MSSLDVAASQWLCLTSHQFLKSLSLSSIFFPYTTQTNLSFHSFSSEAICFSMEAASKKAHTPRQSSYNSRHVSPLSSLRHCRSYSGEGRLASTETALDDLSNRNKENAEPNKIETESCLFAGKENVFPSNGVSAKPKTISDFKSFSTGSALKPSSLQLCMQINEPEKVFGPKLLYTTDSEHSATLKIWDYSDSEAAPASSWSTLPNRSLLCRPLPLDIGKCTCVIVKEALPDGIHGGALYSLYTNEGQGRQDRKLAVALHKRHNGKSGFTIAQNIKGIAPKADDSFIGSITSNLTGSKYHIWDQGSRAKSPSTQSKSLLAAVTFVPTVTTWTGSHRRMRAYVPKHQSMQLKNTTQAQHIAGLSEGWEEQKDKAHQLFSRVPLYNKISKQYELDFRDKGRAGLQILRSVKNFQLTMENNGKQTILQLGRVGKSKYVMDYRYPLTGYQAFCISLASIDSKLCCTV